LKLNKIKDIAEFSKTKRSRVGTAHLNVGGHCPPYWKKRPVLGWAICRNLIIRTPRNRGWLELNKIKDRRDFQKPREVGWALPTLM
jgi:hypothetical protein